MAKEKIEEQQVQQSKSASQRVQTEKETEAASEQRVQSNATETIADQRVEVTLLTTTPTPAFEYSKDAPTGNTPVITQDDNDEEDETPAESHSNKLQSRLTQTMTNEWLYNMMEFPAITTNVTNTVTPKMAASQKYPMQFLCDYENAVINNETGEVMEYQHLLKDPKHRKRWQRLFRNEI